MTKQSHNLRASKLVGTGRRTSKVVVGATAAVAAAVVTTAVKRTIDSVQKRSADTQRRWTRTNYRGNPVSLAAGPGIAAGLIVGRLTKLTGSACSSDEAAQLIVITSAGVLGLIDDLAEPDPARTRGLRGHLSSLRQGRVTTGAVKFLGIGTASLAAAVVLAQGRRTSGCARGAAAADVIIDTALMAGMTNLLNLLDLRPGRALKAATTLSVPVLAHSLDSVAVIGAAASSDLAGTHMAGDAGANALGAAVGATWAAYLPRPLRVTAALGVIGLNLASERVSFSQVIADVEILNAIDQWGVAKPNSTTTEAE